MRLPPSARAAARRPLALVIVSAVLLAGFASAPRAEEAAASPPAPKTLISMAPDFTAEGLDGRTYKLSELLQKGPVLLSFWTTYCKPCMQELPELQKVWERRRDAGFTMLGIACDNSKSIAKVRPTAQSKGFRFPIITDVDQRIMNLYNVRNHPTTVLIAPDGKITLFRLGYSKGAEKDIEEMIVSLLPGGTEGKP